MEARTRLAMSVGMGLCAFAPAIVLLPWQAAVLVGWDMTAAVFILAVWQSVRKKDADATRKAATKADDSRVAADAVLIGASVASLVGVAFDLLHAAASTGATHNGLVAVAVLSVVLSWASVHAVFTLRYAHLYYSRGGGVDFHDDDRPEFADFLYVALTIGMTFQVSDTDLTSKVIRATALRHALLSYLFGVVVVAMTINVVASLLTK